MSAGCFFCGKDLNPHDIGTVKQITGWDTSRALQLALRESTGEYAHAACLKKEQDRRNEAALDRIAKP